LKKTGNQDLVYYNTVFSQRLQLVPSHEFKTLAKE